MIVDVTGVRDAWAQRKGGKSTTRKLTTAVNALTALGQNAPTEAPSPDKNPREFATWLELRAPFNGHMPPPGVFPGALHQVAMGLVPRPRDVDDGSESSASEDEASSSSSSQDD